MKPIPSLEELYTNLAADLKSKLNLSDGDLRFVLDATSAVLSAQFKLAYLYLSDVQNNLFPDTADTAADGGELNRIGQIYLNRQPFPATDGIYVASVSGQAGSVLRAGLTFKSNDDSKSPGNLYVLDAEYILTGSSDEITLRSLNAGPDYELADGDSLTVTEPVIGLDAGVVITDITQAPSSGESIDIYRQAILDAIRLEPQGGAKTDYRIWASDAQGVRKVYPYVKNGDAGTVQVFVEATVEDSTDGHGTPGTPLLDEVEEVIEFDPDETIPTDDRGRRPIQANLEVLPVEVKPVDVDIVDLQIDNSEIRDSIRTNLEAYLYGVRPYIAGADFARDKNDILTSVKAQGVVSDTIGNANTFLDFKLYVDGVELNTYTFAGAIIPYLRDINYL